MSRPAPEPNEPFFTPDINKDFISRFDPEKVHAIKEYEILTLDEF